MAVSVVNYMIFSTIRIVDNKLMGDIYIKAPDLLSAAEIAETYGLIIDGCLIGQPVIDNPTIILVMPETPYAPSIPSEIANFGV